MKRLLLLVIAAGLLAGCAVGPNYRRPKVEVPAAYRGTDATTDPSSLAEAKWFQVFQDQQLQSLIRTALEHNYDMREAAARIEAARAAVGITRADQFPTVAATASVTTQRTSRSGDVAWCGDTAW